MAQSVKFDVRENLRDTLAQFQRATQRDIEAATTRALNRTLTTVRAEASRRLRKLYPGLPARTMKRQMRFKRATKANPTAIVTFSGSRFRLFGNFPVRTRQYRRGIGIPGTANLPKHLETGAGEPITPADVSRIFLNRSKQHKKPNFWLRLGRTRMPIDVVVVRGLAVAFVEENIAAALAPVARARFITVLTQELKFRTGSNG